METRKPFRNRWMDLLRVGATCAVVMLHTVTGCLDRTDMRSFVSQQKIFLICKDLLSWGVPVFLILSGYIFLNPSKQVTMKIMIIKYCKRIVLALFLFGAPYACLEQIAMARTFHIKMIPMSFLMVAQGKSWSHLWYLYLIIGLYIITPLLKQLLSIIPKWSVVVVMIAILVGSSITVYINMVMGITRFPTIPCDMIYLFYYLYGYLLVTKSQVKEEKTTSAKWEGILLLLLIIGIIYSRVSDGYTIEMPYNYPTTIIMALLIVRFVQSKENCCQQMNHQLRRLSAISFTIYLIHPVFLNVFYKFLHFTPLSFNLYLSLPFFWSITLCLSIIGALILEKIPFLKKHIL